MTTVNRSVYLHGKHVLHRMKNRGIGPFVVDLYLLYAEEEHDGRGGIRYFFTRRSRRRVKKELGGQLYKHIRHQLDACVVECDGDVVTVMWRH